MAVERYRQRLSGPIRDRFDLTIEVPRLPFATINQGTAESSAIVRTRVTAARDCQRQRFAGSLQTNATMGLADVERHCRLDRPGRQLLREAVDRWHLSVRGYHGVLKVARTIADLAGQEQVSEQAVAEALQYRQMPAAPASAL